MVKIYNYFILINHIQSAKVLSPFPNDPVQTFQLHQQYHPHN